MNVDADDLAVFLEEATELSADFEQCLLLLETLPDDREVINRAFRAAHTIKGGSGMLGLDHLASFTHELETLLDELRDRQLLCTRAVIDALLASSDVIKAHLELLQQNRSEKVPEQDAALNRIWKVRAEGEGPSAQSSVAAAEASAPKPAAVQAAPVPAAPVEGLEARMAEDERAARAAGLPALTTLPPPRTATVPPPERAAPAQSFEPLPARPGPEQAESPRPGAGPLIPMATSPGGIRSQPPPSAPMHLASMFTPPPSAPPAASSPSTYTSVVSPYASAPRASAAVPEPSPSAPVGPDGAPRAELASSIRVSTEKVDQLVNLVGELSINQAMISELVQSFEPSRILALQESVAQLERNCRDLQQRVLSVRMVPVKGVFDRFHRLVRDVSAQAGKVVALEVRGEETELDKTVVEKIADPLTHLVRNAIDHGLEPPDERTAKGKSAKGVLRLAAYQKGANIFIEVKDDGRGLDRARILKKALSLGLVEPGRELSDEQVWDLIFQPGFSTAEKVTSLSGRGVGMDVVRRNIDALQGKVTIATAPGQGTTFRIQLPLTLAMMDGLLLRVGAGVFLMPLVSVVSSFRPTAKQLGRVDSAEVVEVRGHYLPVVRLYEVLGLEERVEDPTKAILVIVDDGQKTYGLLVDELVGQLQVVVKSLEANYGRVKGISGATILGDGQVALILDASNMLAIAGERPGHFAGGAGPRIIPQLPIEGRA